VTIVYLDQNKWIELAQARWGKAGEKRLQWALERVEVASRDGRAVFPLSAMHYMETSRITNVDRRRRLGQVMWEISGGNTFSWYGALLRHEIEIALAKQFATVIKSPFELISKGISHALGRHIFDYALPEPYRSRFPSDVVTHFEAVATAEMEKAAITGIGPGNIRMTPFTVTAGNDTFKHHLERLPSLRAEIPRQQWDDALIAICFGDIVEPVTAVLSKNGLDWSSLTALGKDALTKFVFDIPSRRVEFHMHRQFMKNPNLKPKITDLEDWAGLGPAVAHSDIVVCEKLFADLVKRDGFSAKAKTVTDICQMAEMLRI